MKVNTSKTKSMNRCHHSNILALKFPRKSLLCLNQEKFQNFLLEYLHRHISSDISMSGKNGGNTLTCITYKLFTNSLAYEPYLKIANLYKRIIIAQFGTSAHRQHIETGRFGHNNTYVPPDREAMRMLFYEQHRG